MVAIAKTGDRKAPAACLALKTSWAAAEPGPRWKAMHSAPMRYAASTAQHAPPWTATACACERALEADGVLLILKVCERKGVVLVHDEMFVL